MTSPLCVVCGTLMDSVLLDLGYSRHPSCERWSPSELASRNRPVKLPSKPYEQDGEASSGWSGTDTSKAAEPVRAQSQRAVLAAVYGAGPAGRTVAELREQLELHHGVTSGALSALHKRGYLARLKEKRGGCRIYIDPAQGCVQWMEHD